MAALERLKAREASREVGSRVPGERRRRSGHAVSVLILAALLASLLACGVPAVLPAWTVAVHRPAKSVCIGKTFRVGVRSRDSHGSATWYRIRIRDPLGRAVWF